MFLSLLILHLAGTDPVSVYNGRQGRLDVLPPRIDFQLKVDGALDETVWAQAALLTGFSQFSPSDGIPAADSTEVLVWYSPTAIHFGIRAYEAHGAVHATLADRDRIGSDDYVQILLSTFDDARQATVLAVNPFGVQSDGALIETGSTQGNGFNNAVVRRESADLSPDFNYESKGRLTDYGYEVEVRVPFKSLRFQPAREQRWGINVTRQVQHSGVEDSWAPAKRASASFLAQSGHLVGLTDLHRGLVLELTPSLTSKTTGTPSATGWDYAGGSPELGASVRWGITNNLNLNGTANPDFSQVESDAGQFLFDPRNEILFSEKRPFFLDGIEQFNTPNSLIYTRRIVQPAAAVKLTGTGLGADVALLSAVDDREVSRSGENHPVYNLLRLQRGVGAHSRVGLVYTDRVEGGDYNRVGGVDGRLVFGEIYSALFQVAGSKTRASGATTTAPLWLARVDRNGRTFGIRAFMSGSDSDFRARSGFFPRPGLVRANLNPRITLYGKSGGLVENVTIDLNLDGQYRYGQFAESAGMQEEKAHFNTNARLRGGWQVGASVLNEAFGYPAEVYTGYRLELPRADGSGADTVPFVGRRKIPNRDYVLTLDTPEFAQFSAGLFLLWGHDENFFEWASGAISWVDLSLNWRPSDKLRLEARYQTQYVGRRTDGSTVNVQHIPRLKMEYQVSRPIFLRLVGEYNSERQDALRDDTRTDAPILIYDPAAGDFVRTAPFKHRSFRGDLLFSYQPTPGTVLFAGYGSTLRDPVDPADPLRTGFHRADDGFFLKMSYLFRT
jgi:Domain of unknown function (DUF5916)